MSTRSCRGRTSTAATDWVYDPSYLLYHAVQEGRKLVASEDLSLPEGSAMPSAEEVGEMLSVDRGEVELSVCKVPDNPYVRELLVRVSLARKGSLREFFDMDEVLEVYRRHGVWLSEEELSKIDRLFDVGLHDLFFGGVGGLNWFTTIDDADCIIAGLGLGYPLESTVSFIQWPI